MRNYLCAGVVILTCCLPAMAQDATLKSARERWLRGNYAEAREQYEKLSKKPEHQVAAAMGLSRVMQSTGEYREALETIEAACKANEKSADLQARRAELLYLAGRWDDALKAVEAALAISKEHFLARWVRAQIYDARGDLEKAQAEYKWFVNTYSSRSEKNDDIKDPDLLLLVGLAGTENARGDKRLTEQFSFILDDVYGDALKYEKAYWPAEYQAGMLLLEKFNYGDALDHFDKALKINARAAEVLAGKGVSALQHLDLKDAERFADRALAINPNLPEALRLRADVALAFGNLDETLRFLEKARKLNTRDESTAARLAGCYYLQHKKDAYEGLAKEVGSYDAKPALFYHELATVLEERRQYDDAEKFYQKAIQLRPRLPGPNANLGLLYMRMGREKEARGILDKAFEVDPFNVRVSNSLIVLRHLDKYETVRTDHFELRFDPKKDRQLAAYMALYLEETYRNLSEQFQYKPTERILFEVFNNKDKFSGRVVALPDLPTIGACTGRMVAMVSPHGQGVGQTFNWARVVRHELVHVFNLEQTKFQVPHWFTEGLAVISEGYPRPQIWNQLLVERVAADKLSTLDNIDMGFMHPGAGADWQMAYCQSQLYIEFMKTKYGAQTVGDMLAAYRDGLDTPAAITRACKVDKAAFEKGYRAYVEEIVKGIKGKRPQKALDFRALKDAHAKDPEDLDVAARLAEMYLRRQDRAEARKLADAVLAKDKNQPMASYVKASLLLAAGESKEAQTLLEAAVNEAAPEPKVLQALAKLYFNDNQAAKAAKMYELGHRAEPYDKKWLEGLAKAHVESGDKDKQATVLKELVLLDADDLDNRRRVAQLLLDANKPEEAERYARQALEIDVLDKEAQETLQKALRAQKKDAEAERMQKILGP